MMKINNNGNTSLMTSEVMNEIEGFRTELHDLVKAAEEMMLRVKDKSEEELIASIEKHINNALESEAQNNPYRVEIRPDLEECLLNNLTDLQKRVLHVVFENGSGAALLGGAVRDAISGKIPNDLDFYVHRTQYDQILEALKNEFEESVCLEKDDDLTKLTIHDLKVDIMVGDEEFELGCFIDFSVNMLFYRHGAEFGLWPGAIEALDCTYISFVDQVIEDINDKIARQIEELCNIGQERVDKMIEKGFKITDESVCYSV